MNTRPSRSLFGYFPWEYFFSMLWMAISAFSIVYGVAYAAGIWAPPIPVVEGITAQYISLVIVNENPAISYYDSTTQDLMYIRADDADGKEWPLSAIQVAFVGDVGQYASMAIVNGFPAISYYDAAGDLKYVRALDDTGIAWGTPKTVDSAGIVGQYTSLAVVGGNPAISYHDVSNDNLKYIQANDANGDSWPASSTTVDSSFGVGQYTSLAVVNENPAISYHDGILGDLKYVRASDANGSAWPTPITLSTLNHDGEYTSLAVVDGFPAVSYYDGNAGGGLKFIRAAESTGMTLSWNAPLTVDSNLNGDVGLYTSLVVVSGNPAISYYDFDNGNLKYARALNLDGSLWNTPAILDDGGMADVGSYSSMAIVNGNPAVSYSGSLWFVRSENPTSLTLSRLDARSMPFSASIPLIGLAVAGFVKLLFYRKFHNKNRL